MNIEKTATLRIWRVSNGTRPVARSTRSSPTVPPSRAANWITFRIGYAPSLSLPRRRPTATLAGPNTHGRLENRGARGPAYYGIRVSVRATRAAHAPRSDHRGDAAHGLLRR